MFNPAAFALAVVAQVRAGGQGWWGAELPTQPLIVALLVATGLLVVDRVNRFAMVRGFLAAYLGLLTGVALWYAPGPVAEAFRAPFVNAALFFAFFMLDDPPTSPGRPREQVRYGVLVAVASVALLVVVRPLAFLPLGLLAGNVWVAVQRTRVRRAPR